MRPSGCCAPTSSSSWRRERAPGAATSACSPRSTWAAARPSWPRTRRPASRSRARRCWRSTATCARLRFRSTPARPPGESATTSRGAATTCRSSSYRWAIPEASSCCPWAPCPRTPPNCWPNPASRSSSSR